MSQKITTKFICNKYDIDKERRDITYNSIEGTLMLSDIDGKSPKDALKIIEKQMQEIAKDIPLKEFKIDIEYFGYDGGFEAHMITKKIRKETDDEVINRLKSIEREKARKQRILEQARRIISENERSEAGTRKDI